MGGVGGVDSTVIATRDKQPTATVEVRDRMMDGFTDKPNDQLTQVDCHGLLVGAMDSDSVFA